METASNFLNYSLQDKPGNVCYGPNSDYVNQIKNSDALNDALSNIIKNNPNADNMYYSNVPLNFGSNELNLHLSYGHTLADIYEYRNGNNVLFSINIKDIYDYDHWKYKDYKIKYWPVVFINNCAYGFQQLGIIEEYNYSIQFDYSVQISED